MTLYQWISILIAIAYIAYCAGTQMASHYERKWYVNILLMVGFIYTLSLVTLGIISVIDFNNGKAPEYKVVQETLYRKTN